MNDFLLRSRLLVVGAAIVTILAGAGRVTAAQAVSGASAISFTLSNGVRVVSIHYPGSTNAFIFTFLSLGLANDGPNQTQWSHLVEHLVIRSTIPGDLSIANAETLPECMHLDFYGNVSNWKEGLSHHKRWLEGLPYTQDSLEAEKPKVKSEGEFTARNYFTHKFALAAWAQGFRHDQKHASVQADIDSASLREIQMYRDNRLVVLSNVVVCVAGGLEPEEVRSVVSANLGGLKSNAKPPVPVKLHPGRREMTWDLNARHLVITWPMPAMDGADFAPLMVAAQYLNARFFSDSELKKLAGMVLAGADLTTPEGNFFHVSASLRPESSFGEVEKKLLHEVSQLASASDEAAMISQQLAESLTTLPDLASIKNQLPPGVDAAMVEGNIGLQWGLNEFLFGSRKAILAKKLSATTAVDVQRASKSFLIDSKSTVVTLQPIKPKEK